MPSKTLEIILFDKEHKLYGESATRLPDVTVEVFQGAAPLILRQTGRHTYKCPYNSAQSKVYLAIKPPRGANPAERKIVPILVSLTSADDAKIPFVIEEDSKMCADLSIGVETLRFIDSLRKAGATESLVQDKAMCFVEYCLENARQNGDLAAQTLASSIADRISLNVPMTFHSDKQLLVCYNGTCQRHCLDETNGEGYTPIELPLKVRDVQCIVPLGGLNDFACGYGDCISLNQERELLSEIGAIKAMAFHDEIAQDPQSNTESSTRMAVGGSNGVISLFRSIHGNWQREKTVFAMSQPIEGVAFSQDGSLLAAIGLFGQMVVFELPEAVVRNKWNLSEVLDGRTLVPLAIEALGNTLSWAIAWGLGASSRITLAHGDREYSEKIDKHIIVPESFPFVSALKYRKSNGDLLAASVSVLGDNALELNVNKIKFAPEIGSADNPESDCGKGLWKRRL